MLDIRGINYKDILKLEPTFISLDISVRSTGWVNSINGNVEWGTYTLKSEDELGRRREFRQFLIDLLGSQEYPVVFVEDVIAGTNFKTSKGLIQLNYIVDDLMDLRIIKVCKITRVDNNRWKKYLRQVSNYRNIGIKEKDVKKHIILCLHNMDFKEEVVQDINDAMGLAVAMIFQQKVLKE